MVDHIHVKLPTQPRWNRLLKWVVICFDPARLY